MAAERVASVQEIPEGSFLAVDVGGVSVLLVHTRGEVRAFDNACTHAGAWLDMGQLHSDADEIECPLHGGRFNASTGAPAHFPCKIPLRRFSCTVADGDVLVDTSHSEVPTS